MEKAEVKFEKWISEGFNLFKENFSVLIVPSLVATLLGAVSCGILHGPMFAGMILIVFALLDKKEPKPQVGDLFKGFEYFLQTLLFVLVWGIGCFVVVFILNLIPCLGILLAWAVMALVSTCLMFGLFLIVDKKMDFWSASMASLEKVKTNFFPFLGLSIIASILGGILCFITLPLYFCIMSIAYREVFGSGASSSAGCCGTCGGTSATPPTGNA